MRKLRSFIKKTKAGARVLGKGNSSYKPWDVENCAEVWAVRNAIMNGVKIENMALKTVELKDLEYAPACNNCEVTFDKLINSDIILKKRRENLKL